MLRHWFKRTPRALLEQPQRLLSRRDATWWRLPRMDSVLIEPADSQGLSCYRADRAQFRAQLRESLRLNRQVERNWSELQNSYRRSMQDITSLSALFFFFNDSATTEIYTLSLHDALPI